MARRARDTRYYGLSIQSHDTVRTARSGVVIPLATTAGTFNPARGGLVLACCTRHHHTLPVQHWKHVRNGAASERGTGELRARACDARLQRRGARHPVVARFFCLARDRHALRCILVVLLAFCAAVRRVSALTFVKVSAWTTGTLLGRACVWVGLAVHCRAHRLVHPTTHARELFVIVIAVGAFAFGHDFYFLATRGATVAVRIAVSAAHRVPHAQARAHFWLLCGGAALSSF